MHLGTCTQYPGTHWYPRNCSQYPPDPGCVPQYLLLSGSWSLRPSSALALHAQYCPSPAVLTPLPSCPHVLQLFTRKRCPPSTPQIPPVYTGAPVSAPVSHHSAVHYPHPLPHTSPPLQPPRRVPQVQPRAEELSELYRELSQQPGLSTACLGPDLTTQYGGKYCSLYTGTGMGRTGGERGGGVVVRGVRAGPTYLVGMQLVSSLCYRRVVAAGPGKG